MNRLMDKLKRMLTAIAYAEAGDLDSVKQMLREESDKQKSEQDAGKHSPEQPALPAT